MIYLVFGSQPALVQKVMHKIALTSVGTPDNFNYIEYSGTQTPIQDIVFEAMQMPFGSDKRVIIVDDAYYFAKSSRKESLERTQDYDKLLEYLSAPNDTTDLIFGVHDGKLATKNRYVELVKTNGEIKEVQDVDNRQWPEFVRRTFAKNNIAISDEAISELIARTNNDVALFLNEADKLSLLDHPIERIDIDLLVTKPLEERSYALTNALLDKNLPLVLDNYRDFLINSQEPITLIGMLANQFRLYSQVFVLADQGEGQQSIAKTLGIHEYRVKLALNAHYKMKLSDALDILEQLHQLDFAIKSNKVDRFYAFELFMVDYCLNK